MRANPLRRPSPRAGASQGAPEALLVIAYGNELRGDDGAAIHAAARITERWPELRVIVVRQLVPELANDIAMAARVIFIDAYAAVDRSAPLRVERLLSWAANCASPIGHRGDPALLLALCARLFDRAPETWVVGIPAFDCAAGTVISPASLRRIDDAVAFCAAYAPARP